MLIEQIAELCHEVNRAYCISQGDFTQERWNNAPDWQKQSAINGVKFHLKNPNTEPKRSHESWMAEKIKAGWTYGLEKDAEEKTHPCLVAYHHLPKEQQAKDYIFTAIVNTIASINEEVMV